MSLALVLLRLVLPPLAAGLLALAGPSAAADLKADAPPVGPFRHIEVSGVGEMRLVQADQERVAIESSPKARARIRIRNRDGTLEIEIVDDQPGWTLFGERPPSPRVTVYFRTLQSIEVAGAVKVFAHAIDVPDLRIEAAGATGFKADAIKVKHLQVEGAGAFKAELAGEATEQRVELAGAGDYRAAQLRSQSAIVSVGGASRVVINAEKTLSVEVSGAGSVEYLGSPDVTQHVSGAGRVRRREAASLDEAPPYRPAFPASRAYARTCMPRNLCGERRTAAAVGINAA